MRTEFLSLSIFGSVNLHILRLYVTIDLDPSCFDDNLLRLNPNNGGLSLNIV